MKSPVTQLVAPAVLLLALTACGGSGTTVAEPSPTPTHEGFQLKDGYVIKEQNQIFPKGTEISMTEETPAAVQEILDLFDTNVYDDGHILAIDTPSPLDQKVNYADFYTADETTANQFTAADDWFVSTSSSAYGDAISGLDGRLSKAERDKLREVEKKGIVENKGNGHYVTYLFDETPPSEEWIMSGHLTYSPFGSSGNNKKAAELDFTE